MASYCTRCEHVGEPETVTPGSFVVEVLLWLCFLVPGLIYSAWRWTKRHPACALCHSPELVPENSPLAQKRMAGDPAMQQAFAASRAMSLRSSLAWLAIFALIAIGIVFASH